MGEIEQRFKELEQRLNNGINHTASKSARFPLLSFMLVLAVIFLAALFANRYIAAINERVDRIETKYKDSKIPPDQTLSSPSLSDPIVNSINARLGTLESLQEAFVSASKSALEQMNFVFSIVAAFFGLFALFFAYRQIVADTDREKHDEEMRGLVGSFRQNITVINDLIATLEKSYSYRAEVETRMKKIDGQILAIEQYKEKTEQSLQEKIANLNNEAFGFFRDHVDRERFKAEENRGKLENFYVNMNALERMGDVSTFFSPLSYFLRALHFFNITQYELYGADLEEARRLGLREIAQPTFSWYGESIQNEVVDQLNRMLDDCSYHLGIIYYNLGQYDKARDRFQETYRKNPLDFRSRSYVPELMFFDTRIPFPRVIAEFSAVEKALKNLSLEDQRKLDWAAAMASLKMREGNCYLPKIIPLPHRAGYRSEESAERASTIYWESYDHAQKIEAKPSLTEIFVRFSLAQALEHLGRSDWRDQTPTELFQQVFFDIRRQTVLKTEPILLTLLNYVMAICASRANISGENPRSYLARAREQLQHVPTQVLIFSPINKINLTREDLVMEMEIFEKSLI